MSAGQIVPGRRRASQPLRPHDTTRVSRAIGVVHIAAIVGLLQIGCISVRAPGFTQPAPTRAWPATLADAQARSLAGRPADADSVLAGFAGRYPASPEGVETNYWRAVFRLDSSATSPVATVRIAAAIPLLNAYLASNGPLPHAEEARSLLRVATLTQQLNTLVATATARAATAETAAANAKAQLTDADARATAAQSNARSSADEASARNDELKKLKDQLDEANTELDRIKKRLADATKKTPAAAPPIPTGGRGG